MTIDAALLEVLQCPSCHGDLSDNPSFLLCSSCRRQFPIIGGIPDLTCFGTDTEPGDFNRTQAAYEAALHDRTAESDYEERIVRIYGTKTCLLARSWAEEIVKLPPPVRVLDYGCGTGQLSRVLGNYCRPLYAADISAASVRKNVAENGVLGCVANGLFLPFKEKVFDVVCLSGVLHHIVDLGRAIEEISRIAKNYVFVSDIMPCAGPAIRRVGKYPRSFQKLLYGSWTSLGMANAVAHKLMTKTKNKLRNPKPVGESIQSRYEKPIAAETVEALFRNADFVRERMRYWTNLSFPGNGPLKRWATKMLVNDTVGTHFDLILRRNHRKSASSL
jgi:SAM-dependent methyltransferase